MKNYRNGKDDVSPPFERYHHPPAWSGIRFGSAVMIFGPGPKGVAGDLADVGQSTEGLLRTMLSHYKRRGI